MIPKKSIEILKYSGNFRNLLTYAFLSYSILQNVVLLLRKEKYSYVKLSSHVVMVADFHHLPLNTVGFDSNPVLLL
jgi:hypothetical protein